MPGFTDSVLPSSRAFGEPSWSLSRSWWPSISTYKRKYSTRAQGADGTGLRTPGHGLLDVGWLLRVGCVTQPAPCAIFVVVVAVSRAIITVRGTFVVVVYDPHGW